MTKLVHGQTLTATCQCGEQIIRDDDAQALLHPDPVCEWFKNLMSRGSPEVRNVAPDAVAAHLSALRARVRNTQE
jgi:hypothetical protein